MRNKFDKLCILVTVLAMLGTVLFMNGEALGLSVLVDADAEIHSDDTYFTENDQDASWSTENATVITLDQDMAKVTGQGAYANDGSVYITNAGRYVVSGTLTDGKIVVDAEDYSKVWILLDGVEISCTDDACIRVEEADKVFLTLADDTENTLASGETYTKEALADGTGGVIYAHDDLTINGSGSLSVTAAYKHGIEANDDLVITGGTITIDAPGDGLHVNDSLRMTDTTLTVTAGDNGIDLDGSDNAEAGAESGYLYIASGTYVLDSEDDGIHTAGDITIDGGALRIRSGDDGIHADTAFSMMGGTILVEECYEGIEAVTIDIAGGDVTVYPTDDGLNANGSVGFGMDGMQMAGETVVTDETWIRISDGSVTVINDTGRDADGLDSNGDICITGGTVRISLEGSGGSNSAIDYGSESGGVLQVSGGTIVACGGSSMAEPFDESSAQVGVLYNSETAIAAGTEVQLLDAEGEVLLSYTPVCAWTSVAVSCPEIEVGETYTLVAGDLTADITPDATAVTVGTAGMQAGGMQMGGGMSPGGGMHMGGMRPGSQSTQDGERPEMPEGMEAPQDGERPEMPEGMEAPQDGERPEMPEGMEAPQDGERPEMPEGMEAPQEGSASETEESAEDAAAAEELTEEEQAKAWRYIAISAAVLAAAIAVALRYRRG